DPEKMLLQQLLSPVPGLAVMLCMVTMRARNGYCGLHDLATGTRVVMLRPADSGVQGFPLLPVKPHRLDDGPQAFGPFEVRGLMGRCDGATVYAARDDTLKRRVWVFARPGTESPVATSRTQISRVTRPRWLQGGTSTDERWDAFEAVRGAPVTELGSISWDHGRFILRDLAEELATGVADSTLPARLNLDQVWLDEDGRVRLLDAPLED